MREREKKWRKEWEREREKRWKERMREREKDEGKNERERERWMRERKAGKKRIIERKGEKGKLTDSCLMFFFNG